MSRTFAFYFLRSEIIQSAGLRLGPKKLMEEAENWFILPPELPHPAEGPPTAPEKRGKNPVLEEFPGFFPAPGRWKLQRMWAAPRPRGNFPKSAASPQNLLHPPRGGTSTMPFPRKVGKPQISREYPSLELRGIHSEEEEDGRSPKTHLGEARSAFLVNLGEFGISWGWGWSFLVGMELEWPGKAGKIQSWICCWGILVLAEDL